MSWTGAIWHAACKAAPDGYHEYRSPAVPLDIANEKLARLVQELEEARQENERLTEGARRRPEVTEAIRQADWLLRGAHEELKANGADDELVATLLHQAAGQTRQLVKVMDRRLDRLLPRSQ